MKVISTNIGESKTVNWHGQEVTTGIFKYPINEPIYLGTEDVDNDDVMDRKYHGGIDKACYIYSADHYEYWKKLHHNIEIPWGMFGENLTVEGLDESEINVGDILKIGEATVQATQPRQPCFKLDIRFNTSGLVKQFVDSNFPGVYVRVLENGKVKTGDRLESIKKENALSIKRIFQLLYASDYHELEVKTAINNPHIAASCKKDLVKKWSKYL